MKTLILVTAFCFAAFFSFAQNLVPNASFEDTVACPTNISKIFDAVGWNTYRNTPDYFNACGNGQAGVPSNLFGYQNARTGNAYAGFYTYFGPSEYREWVGCQLIHPLIIGHKYSVSFFVSLATKHNLGINTNTATNKIGLRFSTFAYSQTNAFPLDGYCQVYTDSVIADTTNWVNISGSFIADSAYNFIVIGNFFSDSTTTRFVLDSVSGFTNCAYYYIDDISVIDSSIDGIEDDYLFKAIKIFPNPARDWIVVEGRDIKSFYIFDALGRNCIENDFASSSLNKIDLSLLSKGIYFIRVNTSKNFFIEKIIVNY